MKSLKMLAAMLVLLSMAWSGAALADDDGRERERKYEEWAREDAKRHDEWVRESYKRDAEQRREHAKDQREHAKEQRKHEREERKRAEEYWRERDKAEADAYRDWLGGRSRNNSQYRRAYDFNRLVGRVVIGSPLYDGVFEEHDGNDDDD